MTGTSVHSTILFERDEFNVASSCLTMPTARIIATAHDPNDETLTRFVSHDGMFSSVCVGSIIYQRTGGLQYNSERSGVVMACSYFGLCFREGKQTLKADGHWVVANHYDRDHTRLDWPVRWQRRSSSAAQPSQTMAYRARDMTKSNKNQWKIVHLQTREPDWSEERMKWMRAGGSNNVRQTFDTVVCWPLANQLLSFLHRTEYQRVNKQLSYNCE